MTRREAIETLKQFNDNRLVPPRLDEAILFAINTLEGLDDNDALLQDFVM